MKGSDVTSNNALPEKKKLSLGFSTVFTFSFHLFPLTEKEVFKLTLP